MINSARRQSLAGNWFDKIKDFDTVMPALVCGHPRLVAPTVGKDVDGRVKPGHDEDMLVFAKP
jgi:hypothetical protein